MKKINEMNLRVLSLNINESFARSTVCAFCAQANPTIEVVQDIKTAVSEAVTNCVVHAYDEKPDNYIDIDAVLYEEGIEIIITDYGVGIEDVEQARMPFYTTRPDQERTGMGFEIMKTFMDELYVESNENGTIIKMVKYFDEV